MEHAAVPTLRFNLAVDAAGAAVRSVALSVQLRIAATRRRYDAAEQERLVDLFGLPSEWARNLHGLHWTNLTANIGSFTASTEVELPVTCTYDLEVVGARYMSALEDGEIPLEFLFSGTVFYSGADGCLQVGRIGWDKECSYRLPVAVWRAMIERYFPATAWMRLGRDSFERLRAYRARHTLMSWDDAIDRLLKEADQ